ncbi:MAG TPA: hypothetical protein PK829_13965 [Promineifilum sp.]|nr:hypothetical protein [Promineifilum sp.]
MYALIRRQLNDYDRWKETVTTLDGLRAQYGSRGMTIFRAARDPNEVYLLLEWDDDKSPDDYLNLPQVQQALASTGTSEVIAISEVMRLPY